PRLGYKPMACADCHRAEPGGLGFLAANFKDNCQSCHKDNLVFEGADLPWPKGQVPHGNDTGIVSAVWNFYAAKALRSGGVQPATLRRAAGVGGPPQPERTNPEDRIAQQTQSALGVIFDEKRGC